MLKKVIKCHASWCGPCKRLEPIFDEISKMEEYKDIEFKKVDVDNDEELLVEKYQIRSIPTVILVDENGEAIKKLVGLLPSKESYIAEINEELAKNALTEEVKEEEGKKSEESEVKAEEEAKTDSEEEKVEGKQEKTE